MILSVRGERERFNLIMSCDVDQRVDAADDCGQKDRGARDARGHLLLREKAINAARDQDRHEESGSQKITGHTERRDDIGNEAYSNQDKH